jgi:hypothetical protein
MIPTPLRALGATLVTSLLFAVAPAALAATPKTCDKLHGRDLVTVIETSDTLIGEAFLTDRVLNAATGRRLYTYLNTSSAPAQPSLALPLRTLLSPAGALVGLFPLLGADGSQATDRLVAFVSSKGQTLDTANDGSIPAASITFTGNVVTWTDAGTAKSATIGTVAAR